MNINKYIRINLYSKHKKLSVVTFILNLLIAPLTFSANQHISIATQNAYNFYNDKDDHKKERLINSNNYQLRLTRLATQLIEVLKSPDIIALQEVENFDTLYDLKRVINKRYQQCYEPVLFEGHVIISINVAYLVRCNLTIKNTSQLFKTKKLTKHSKALFTRPPLYLEVCTTNQQCLHLVNVHLRSMLGLKSIKKRQYVIHKRHQQAKQIALWIEQFQTQWPDKSLVILGDFNALKGSDRFVDVLGIIKGSQTQLFEQQEQKKIVHKSLFDPSLRLNLENRVSYIYKNNKQSIDYILISQNLTSRVESIFFSPINYLVSDHAGINLTLSLD